MEKKPNLVRVAGCEVGAVESLQDPGGRVSCEIEIRTAAQSPTALQGSGESLAAATLQALRPLCYGEVDTQAVEYQLVENPGESLHRYEVVLEEIDGKKRVGFGKAQGESRETSIVVALLRAANHAGLLRPAFRANNQKALRNISREVVDELKTLGVLSTTAGSKAELEADGVILEHLNRVASAAVITATNSPRPDSILSLFDTSVWLFDRLGQRRSAYTETDLWLAWYPGIDNGESTIEAVINSMPASPDTAIPWIVKLFENPESWLRFRGAISLEDHDVMHALVGRGLQDQDEAFVLGFAMGTAKRVNKISKTIFRWILSRVYPEPYRIPRILLPAFELGIECGLETGAQDLYKQNLSELMHLTLDEARAQCGIDTRVLRKYFDLEQQQIPFTIASLRLP